MKPKAKKIGTAMNAEAASSLTGFSSDQINAARDAGCRAFHPSGRIDCDELVNWMAVHPEVVDMHGKVDKRVEETLRIRVDRLWREEKLKAVQKKNIPRVEIGRRLMRLAKDQKDLLNQSLPEQPELVDRICRQMQQLVEEWIA